MKRYAAFAAAAILASVSARPVFAQTAPATAPVANPSEEIKLLRARLDSLEKQQADIERAQVKKATIEQVITDAERHSMLLDAGDFTAGYKDGRFFLGSSDGNFVLRPWFHFQGREATVLRQDFKKGGTEDNVDSGFEIRRMRFGFDGNVFSPDLTYFFNWATVRANGNTNVTGNATSGFAGQTIGTASNNLGGTPLLEEAWVKYHFANSPWYIKGGQIKDPLLHDQIVSSRYQQSTERSLIADIFANGDDFVEGLTLIYDPDSWFRAEGGVTHGSRSANTNFLDYPQANAFDYGAAGRAEFKVFGNWRDYAQIGNVGTKDPLLVFGVGADYAERGHSNQIVGVVDGMYTLPGGFNVYAAAVDRYTNHNFGIFGQSATGASLSAPPANVLGKNTNEYAAMIQAGYHFGEHWEPFGRYEYIHLEGTPTGSKNYFQSVVGGVNYYFVGHRAKITTQLNYLPNGIPIDDTPNDIFANPGGHGELLGEVQFQLLL